MSAVGERLGAAMRELKEKREKKVSTFAPEPQIETKTTQKQPMQHLKLPNESKRHTTKVGPMIVSQ